MYWVYPSCKGPKAGYTLNESPADYRALCENVSRVNRVANSPTNRTPSMSCLQWGMNQESSASKSRLLLAGLPFFWIFIYVFMKIWLQLNFFAKAYAIVCVCAFKKILIALFRFARDANPANMFKNLWICTHLQVYVQFQTCANRPVNKYIDLSQSSSVKT